jgi:hypothetical protein
MELSDSFVCGLCLGIIVGGLICAAIVLVFC